VSSQPIKNNFDSAVESDRSAMKGERDRHETQYQTKWRGSSKRLDVSCCLASRKEPKQRRECYVSLFEMPNKKRANLSMF
jgi:hypothetical protein